MRNLDKFFHEFINIAVCEDSTDVDLHDCCDNYLNVVKCVALAGIALKLDEIHSTLVQAEGCLDHLSDESEGIGKIIGAIESVGTAIDMK